MYRNTYITLRIDMKIVSDLFDMRFTRYSSIHICTRLSTLFAHHLLYHTTNETIAFFCFTRRCARTYSHTLILIYVRHYYAANLV